MSDWECPLLAMWKWRYDWLRFRWTNGNRFKVVFDKEGPSPEE